MIILIQIKYSHSHGIETIITDFKKISCENSSVDTTVGTIYYDMKTTFMIVNSPVNQRMMYLEDTLKIYYPESNQLFIFTSEQPFNLPFFQAFFAVVNNDYGLSEAGFSLESTTIHSDTLISRWKLVPSPGKGAGETILKFLDEKIVSIDLFDSEGVLISQNTLEDHFEYASFYFPRQIIKQVYNQDNSTTEQVQFSNTRFNTLLPDSIQRYMIPPNAELKVIEW